MDVWLQQVEQEGSEEDEFQLLHDLDTKIPRAEAVEYLTLILDSVYENYGEYRDYNSTTDAIRIAVNCCTRCSTSCGSVPNTIAFRGT